VPHTTERKNKQTKVKSPGGSPMTPPLCSAAACESGSSWSNQTSAVHTAHHLAAHLIATSNLVDVGYSLIETLDHQQQPLILGRIRRCLVPHFSKTTAAQVITEQKMWGIVRGRNKVINRIPVAARSCVSKSGYKQSRCIGLIMQASRWSPCKRG
jgi:hypothetical protein